MYKSLENHIRGIMSKHYITEATMGGKEYPHLDLCPQAIKQFKKDLEMKGDSDPGVHAAMKAVNDYLAIEQKAIDGNATEDDHEKMEDLVDVAKQKIADAGLSGHDYHEMHLDRTEKMIEGEDEDDDDDEMEEQNGKPPFTGGTKRKGVVTDKSGAKHGPMSRARDLAQRGKRKQMGESILDNPIQNPYPDDNEPASPEEMSMGLRQLRFMVYAAEEIADHLAGGGRWPEWMQNKLTKAHYIMKGLHSNIDHEYSDDDMDEEVDLDEADFDKNFSKRIGAKARGGKGADYLTKKADQAREYGTKQDPGAAKKGLGPAVVDRQKAYQKARKKGLPPGQRVPYSGTYSKDKRRLPEEMELIEANAFANAGRALNDYARKSGGVDKADFEKASKFMYQIGKADIMTKGTHLSNFSKFFRDLDTDVRDRIVMILKQNNIMESLNLDEKKQLTEPAASQAQQQAAGAALSAKRGEIDPSELQGGSKQMYDTMTAKELEKFAGTKHAGLPKKVSEETVAKSFVRSMLESKLKRKS